jgi:hypothetical protein
MPLPTNSLLDIVISLALIYALLSILVSIITEAWNYASKSRGKFLKASILQLLKDPFNHDYGNLFYDHFLISGLRKDKKNFPQYISSSLFADVLIDILCSPLDHLRPVRVDLNANGPGKVYTAREEILPDSIQARLSLALQRMKPSPFSDAMASFWLKSGQNADAFKALLENWYNDYQDRVSGWFKAAQRFKFIVAGLAVALLLNADSLFLIKTLSLDDRLRGELVGVAEQSAKNYQALSDRDRLKTNKILNSVIIGLPDSTKKIYGDQLNSLLRVLPSDSSRLYLEKADSVLGLAASLNIPIGWHPQVAPLSWFSQGSCPNSNLSPGLLAFTKHRNCFTLWNLGAYILGILISTVSLSFGAPFWFDLLVKFINIRRAGAKPDPDKSNKS